MVLSVAARWGHRTVVCVDNVEITGLVSEQGAMGHLLKTCHNTEIGFNTCVVFLRYTKQEVFTLPLQCGNIWNKSGL